MDKLISVLASPIPFILLISLVITVHELGHYGVGRFFGAAVESFSVGFGKSIAEVTDRRGTRWRINWLPLGGFVKFVGELQTPQDHMADRPAGPIGKAYTELGPLKRLAVSLGGPFANFIFAIVVFAGMGMFLGVPASRDVRVTTVQADSPADAAGFVVGDIITEAGGRQVETGNDVIRATFLSAGEPVRYRIIRSGQEIELTATPIEAEARNEALKVVEKVGRVGLQLEDVNLTVRRLNPIEAVGHGVATTGEAISNTVNVLRRLVTGKDGIEKMSGPVGIFSLTDNVTDMHLKRDDVGFGDKFGQLSLGLLELAALLSIGVGFFNLLPIPVLDGGAAVMCLAEAATGREIPEKVQRVGLTIGLACLVSFALVITWQDVSRIVGWPAAP